MPKFIFLYRGTIPELTPEQGEERGAAFAAWIEKLGPALVDVGSPFVGARTSVCDDGSEGAPGELSGYSIVEANDLAEAKAMTNGLPFLTEHDGKHAIEIFELMSM
jgi:hypothetical protein